MSDQKIESNPEEPIVFSKEINRRSFLKVSGATAGAAAVVGATQRPVLRTLEELSSKQLFTDASEQIFRGVCRTNCFGYCPLNVHVRDGKVVKTSPAPHINPRYNRICHRGLTHAQKIYSPNRIKYPMKRVGPRGGDQWERISWDEAITTITDQWKDIQKKFGKQAVSFFVGSGNNNAFGNLPGLVHRFRNLIGATDINAANDTANLYGVNRILGTVGLWVSNEFTDAVNAKTIIAWGYNLTESTPQSWHFIADALEAGARLIVIDPVHTILASKADKFIPIRPGTDAALILSIMQVIISEDLHNKDFILAHTVAPLLVRDDTKLFLRMSDLGVAPQEGPLDAKGNPTFIDPIAVWDPAKNTAVPVGSIEKPDLEGSFIVQGIKVRSAFTLLKDEVNKYPPEVASKLTDIDPETIKYLAKVCVDTPVFQMLGYGSQAYDNGVHACSALATLAAVTGNIGYPGATVGSNWILYPGVNWGFQAPDGNRGLTISHLVYRKVIKTGTFQGNPLSIKSVFFQAANPVNTSVNTNEIINDVLPTFDLIVVSDSVWTDTVRYADIVLPSAEYFEQEEIVVVGQSPYIQFSQKAIDPLYESKPDAEIYRLLAIKMGVEKYFPENTDELFAETISSKYSETMGISVDTLREKLQIRWFAQDPYIPFNTLQFPTPSGRIQFYLEAPSPRVPSDEKLDIDRERLPRFFPPTEAWPENPLYPKYPLVLLSERPKFRVHSMWFDTPWLRELDPEPIVKISAMDALARDIKNGDYVEVFNDRGHAVVKAVVTQGVRPGVMVFPKGWQRKQYKAGDLSELASSSFDPFAVNNSFMDELAEVRKWNGEV